MTTFSIPVIIIHLGDEIQTYVSIQQVLLKMEIWERLQKEERLSKTECNTNDNRKQKLFSEPPTCYCRKHSFTTAVFRVVPRNNTVQDVHLSAFYNATYVMYSLQQKLNFKFHSCKKIWRKRNNKPHMGLPVNSS